MFSRKIMIVPFVCYEREVQSNFLSILEECLWKKRLFGHIKDGGIKNE